MAKLRRARFVALTVLLARRRFDADDGVITSGRVLVDGRVISNPAALVRSDCALRVLPTAPLRGERKLSAALDRLSVPVEGSVALDVGASAGGFTTALLARGARRVYAVDAGVGQLVGRLRNDPRVVNLEGHNLGDLDTACVPELIDLVALDVSYLSLARAIPQLERVPLRSTTHVVALVKPTFELHRATLASSDEDVVSAVRLVEAVLLGASWAVVGRCPAPSTGRRGAREMFVHARRELGSGTAGVLPS